MTDILVRTLVHQKPTLENSIHYIAHTFSFLATGKDTDNAFALIHCHFRQGFTPPAHFHQYEDESFYLLEGEFEFRIGERKFIAHAGEFVLLPKGVPHQFKLLSETAKALLLITPAGFEEVFREFGRPAQTLDLPPIPTDLNKEVFQKLHNRMIEYGNVWIPEF
jgi:quercetin dioxygenase-like cupin family protein